jgi:DNA-binding transcriptional regulator YdaS (Cro superfamily)
MRALDLAIEFAGGVSKLADKAGVRQSVISMARSRESVSPELALAIERATGGRVTKESLVWGNDKEAA